MVLVTCLKEFCIHINNSYGKGQSKRLAKVLYLQGKSQKEIAMLTGVTDITISRWVTTGNWKTIRDAKVNTGKQKVDNIKQILSDIAEETIELNRQIAETKDREKLKELRKQRNKLADEAAKWNKALENLDAENKISFATYIQIFEEIFKALREFDQKLYMKTIDFQQQHLEQKANQYK